MNSFKIYFLLLSNIFFLSNLSWGQWQEVNTPVGSNYQINDLFFLNENTGFLLASDEVGVYKTSNGGDSWESYNSSELSLNSGAAFTGEYIEFFDDESGYLVVKSNYNYYLFHSEDGGGSWTQIAYLGRFLDAVQIDFYNEKFGVFGAKNEILYSKDSANTWASIDLYYSLEGFQIIDSTRFNYSVTKGQNRGGYAYSFDENREEIKYFPYRPGEFCKHNNAIYTSSYSSMYFLSGWYEDKVEIEGSSTKDFIYSYSNDTLIGADDKFVYITYNNGIDWYKQPGTYQELGFAKFRNFLRVGKQIYTSCRNKLYRLDSIGTDDSPSLKVEKQTISYVCPDSIFTFKYTGGVYDKIYWENDSGEVISNSEEATLIAPVTYLDGYRTCWLFVEYNGYLDSLKCFYKPSLIYKAPDFKAWLHPVKDCDTEKERVFIYPYHSEYRYTLNESTYLVSSEFKGDTAIFVLDVEYNTDDTISGRYRFSNNCPIGEERKKTLTKTTEPYFFNDPAPIWAHEAFCTYDTVIFSIPSSEAGAKYWVDNYYTSQELPNPDTVIGTGDTIVFKLSPEKYNYSFIKIKYDSKTGCSGVSSRIEIPHEKSDVRWSVNKKLYETNEPVDVDVWVDETDSLLSMVMNSDDLNLGYETIMENHQFSLEDAGDYKLQFTTLTQHECKYQSEKLFIHVADSIKGFRASMCEENTVESSFPITLSTFIDSTGIYKAGYRHDKIYNSQDIPVQFFAKYSHDGHLIWEHKLSSQNVKTSRSDYQCSYGRGIFKDDSGFVYVTGQAKSGGVQLGDVLVYNKWSKSNLFLYLAKLDPVSGEVIWMNWIEGDLSGWSATEDNGFVDALYHDGKIYLLAEFDYSMNDLYFTKDGITKHIEEFDRKSSKISFLAFNTGGDFVLNEPISKKINYNNHSHFNGHSIFGFGYSEAGFLNVDKQNNINIRVGWTVYSTNGVTIQDVNVWGYDFRIPPYVNHHYETQFTYKPDYGVINAKLNFQGGSYFWNINHNNAVFDSYGNVYSIHNTGGTVTGLTHVNSFGFIDNKIITGSSGIITKVNASGDLVWYRSIRNGYLYDIEISDDEKHIGLTLKDPSNHRYSIESEENKYQLVKGQTKRGVYIQYSSEGNLENHLRTGNSDCYIYKDENGYFNLSKNLMGDIIAKIDDFDGGCPEYANSKPINDTLFLKEQAFKNACLQKEFYLPWVATDGVGKVTLSYKVNNDSKENIFAENVSANEYGLICNFDSLVNVNSLTFKIVSSDQKFTDEQVYTFASFQVDTLESQRACIGDSLKIGNQVFTENGFYYDTIPNTLGCNNIHVTPVEFKNNPIRVEVLAEDTLCVGNYTLSLPEAEPFGGSFLGDIVNEDQYVISDDMFGSYNFVYAYNDLDGCIWTDTTELYVDYCLNLKGGFGNGNFRVLPNPVSEAVNVTLPSNGDYTIEIISSTGEVVYFQEHENVSMVKINRNGLSRGVYILKVRSGGMPVSNQKLLLLDY